MNPRAIVDLVDPGPLLRHFYERRRILVVGADGFLGYNFVRMLSRLNARITILTRSLPSRAAALAQRAFHGDLRNEDIVRDAIKTQELVVDFAGSFGAVASNQNPQASLEQDCRGHLNLALGCARASSSPPFVFASSRLVYGPPQYLPVDENHPTSPQSMYAVHKLTVENYLKVLGHSDGLRFCILRLSNPYGPYQAESGKGYGVVNRFIAAASRGEEIVLFGNGQQLRDYIYVDDVSKSILAAAAEGRGWGEIFNLGGQSPVRLADAALYIAEVAGGTPVRFAPWPQLHAAVETGDYATNNGKFASRFKLPPQLPWSDGVARTLHFYRSEREGWFLEKRERSTTAVMEPS